MPQFTTLSGCRLDTRHHKLIISRRAATCARAIAIWCARTPPVPAHLLAGQSPAHHVTLSLAEQLVTRTAVRCINGAKSNTINNQPSKEAVSCNVRVYSCKCVPDAALARLRLRCKARQRTRARLSHVPVNRLVHEYCLLLISMSQRAPKIPRKAAGSGQRRDAVAGHAGA